MALLMLGLSHKTAPVELREALALDAEAFLDSFTPLRESGLLDELVLISTCNRVEAYAVSAQPEEAEAALRRAFEHKAGARGPQARKALGALQGDDMLWHLLQVAASLDSMVLGEAQILGQVKDAYERAVHAKAVGPVFHGLFQRVFAAAKEVRTRTDIGRHAASVPSIGVQLAERLFGDLARGASSASSSATAPCPRPVNWPGASAARPRAWMPWPASCPRPTSWSAAPAPTPTC
jgi:glutamyl-tRNA reductase